MTTRLNETGYAWLLKKLEKWAGFITVQATPVVDDGRLYYDTTVTGTPPMIPGYTFRGVVEHLSEGNILKSVPGGPELPVSYRDAAPICQHCLLSRSRNSTFVLQSDTDGSYLQIGRNCLAEYLRDASAAEALLSFATIIDEIMAKFLDPEYTQSRGGRTHYSVESLVAISIVWADQFGWVSGKEAFETGVQSSATLIRNWLMTPERDRVRLNDVRTWADSERVINWVLQDLGTREQVSNYESNLVVLFRQQYVTADKIGLVTSAHRAYAGHQAYLARQSQKVGGHVGIVATRSEHEVTCVLIRSLGVGEYGERFLVKFVDGAGNQLVWFTGEGCDWDQGEKSWMAARVEQHDEYQGQKQTRISRVKKLAGPTPPKKKREKKNVS